MEIATGTAIVLTIGPTRTEYDIANTIETDPDAEWIFLVDQLNIHKSASLVRLVAACCQIHTDLGVKEQKGILKSMASRAAFLSDASHRIRFVYIPKHTSWLNQIECGFSILVRRLLRRASFTSTLQLSDRHESLLPPLPTFKIGLLFYVGTVRQTPPGETALPSTASFQI